MSSQDATTKKNKEYFSEATLDKEFFEKNKVITPKEKGEQKVNEIQVFLQIGNHWDGT